MTIAQCTRPMVDSPSGIAYNSYTTFYTHAESMCAAVTALQMPHIAIVPDTLDFRQNRCI